MSYVVETKDIENYRIKISYDEDSDSPRDWDNLSTMVYFDHDKLGDNHPYKFNDYSSWEEMRDAIIENEDVHTICPLYVYKHGPGCTKISMSNFNDQFDSRQLGWIYASKKDLMGYSDDAKADVEAIFQSEIDVFNKYLNGEVYSYNIYEISVCDQGHEHEDHKDSCGGWYDQDEAMKDAEGLVEYYLKDKTSL
jgi:hypothetical protein